MYIVRKMYSDVVFKDPELSDIKMKLDAGGAVLQWDKRDKWQKEANDYRVTLKYKNKSMSFDFWTGKGWTKDPELNDILSSMFSDGNVADYKFDEFCDEFGYNADSISAKNTYKQLLIQAKKFHNLLGDDYDVLHNEFEQLGY